MNIYADLHIHSCLSPCADNDMTPYNICAMAKIKGLQAIAVTDHNSARNLPAAYKAAQAHGLVLLPGVELSTREEVHLLAYFPTVEQALAMGDFLYSHMPDIQNDTSLFGKQQIMNERDEVTGEESRLLISATDLSLNMAAQEIRYFGGMAVPAHINRGANGLLVNLGFLPEDVCFPALEVVEQLPISKDILRGKVALHASDAHRLEDISEAIYSLEATELSPIGILVAMGYNRVRPL
jgi:3',5'-nucleoside bisphosphate phosphatase